MTVRRAAAVAATCLATVQAAAAGKRRAAITGGLYYDYVTAAQGPIRNRWQRDSAHRLGALQLHARVLRRGVAARARFLRFSRQVEHAMPDDFCASAGSASRPCPSCPSPRPTRSRSCSPRPPTRA